MKTIRTYQAVICLTARPRRWLLAAGAVLLPFSLCAAILWQYTCQPLPKEEIPPGYDTAGLTCSEDLACDDACDVYEYPDNPGAGNCVYTGNYWQYCNQRDSFRVRRLAYRGSCKHGIIASGPGCYCSYQKRDPVISYVTANCGS
ncbi:hypothetical protein [Limisphaera sp. 4302-co]|uniref:hypothetical protein n=1 Tax=Limisphaera sp. 4302-co TaxID=3400417 RepID=UPI003C172A8F